MGLLDILFGETTEVSQSEIDKLFKDVLSAGETVEKGYKLSNDIWLFTSNRVIILNIQDEDGEKNKYNFIPYQSLSEFGLNIEYKKDDCELTLRISEESEPLKYTYKKNIDVFALTRRLAKHFYENSK